MKTMFVAGNWKMNTTREEARALASAVAEGVSDIDVRLAVCPPFVYLTTVQEALGSSRIALGAQNCYHEAKGAFTGEVSAPMLADLGCRYVIVGHSERRTLFGETDADVNRRLQAAAGAGLIPIFCVGETLEEREADATFRVVERQVRQGLEGYTPAHAGELVVAYEPVWAIGTGRAATAEQAQEVHAFIRSLLRSLYGDPADDIALLYGGSVTPENADDLFAQPDVNGGLVGGASLKADAFLRIARAAHTRHHS